MSKNEAPRWHKPYYRWLNYLAGPILIAVSLPDVLNRGVTLEVRRFIERQASTEINGFFIALVVGVIITVLGWWLNAKNREF